jgi:hypothetical protein
MGSAALASAAGRYQRICENGRGIRRSNRTAATYEGVMLSVSSLSLGDNQRRSPVHGPPSTARGGASLSASNVCDWVGIFREPHGQRRRPWHARAAVPNHRTTGIYRIPRNRDQDRAPTLTA